MVERAYALYLGCIIPYREMSYEVSARRVAKDLEITLHDMPDTNCCGLPLDPVNHRMMILLAGSISTLTGCSLLMCQAMPEAPIKPKLESLSRTDDGEIALNRSDSEKLGLYILNLERGYK